MAPKTTEPEVEAPVVDAPAADAPAVEAPVADVPEVIAEPVADVPEVIAEPEIPVEAPVEAPVEVPVEPAPVSEFARLTGDFAALATTLTTGVREVLGLVNDAHAALHQAIPRHPASMLHVRRLKTAVDDFASVLTAVENTAAALAGHVAENES